MTWKSFHHPDWSLPVVTRRASDEWLDILAGVGEILTSHGRSVLWNKTYPSSTAYYSAMTRLYKNGLLVRADAQGKMPRIFLSEAARARQPAYHKPEKFWSSGWNGIWYMLIFDVPETQRYYRDALRRFLKTLRMGCLQKSVWITPRDIRPEYDDLDRAASIKTVAYLLESRTVLHQDQQEMVTHAWDFRRLNDRQARYLEVFGDNLKQVKKRPHSEEELMELLYQESEAYILAMQDDPLLPKELHPKEYLGPQIWALRNKLRKTIAQALSACHV